MKLEAFKTGGQVLVVVIAAFAAFILGPYITRDWQNHDRSLDVKTSLVKEISEATARALTTARLVATDVIVKTGVSAQGPFNAGLSEWETKRAEIGPELQAYFSDANAAHDWDRYGGIVDGVYFLSATGVEDRAQRIKDVRTALRQRGWCKSSRIDWTTLANENDPPRSRSFRASYLALNNCVLVHADDIVRQVLRSTPSGF